MNTFAQYELPDGNNIRMGFVPDNLRMTLEQFETLWELQPVEPQQIRMSGRMISQGARRPLVTTIGFQDKRLSQVRLRICSNPI